MVLAERVGEALPVLGVDESEVVAVDVLPGVVVALIGVALVVTLLEGVEGRVKVIRVVVDVLPHRVHHVHVVGVAWKVYLSCKWVNQ